MTIRSRLVAFIATFLLPAFAFAAAPGNVTGIHATLQGGKVLVEWTPVTDQHIASYQVFFSHASILGNNGLYDDYDTVDGSVNSDLLQNVPPVQTLYVSVLAVNDQGQTSPFFAEEASVNLNGGTAASSAAMSSAGFQIPTLTNTSSAAASIPTTTSTVLRLINAQSISATGVLLTFTSPVAVDPAQAQTAFTIKTASGDVLALTRLTIQGNTIQIDTAPQWQNTVYQVTVGNGVTGKDANGNMIPFDSTQGPTLFTGSPNGIPPQTQPTQQQQTSGTTGVSNGNDVSNLRLRAQAGNDGTYTVQASWLAPATGSIASYQVAQSTNGGVSFGPAATVDRSAGGISVPNVPAGNFAVMVKVVYTDGTTSRGIMQTINLPTTGTTMPQNGQQANVTQQPTGTTKLPQSGPADIAVLLAMAGAVVGYRVMQKKTVAV
ncbi:MAG TPA: Ig-like domain-containing protein [Candidatus Peribacteraceae bacterium]|nr:Ig-like domain-containing protein [Candidatus Peribacteraceae bacterium]